MKHTVAFSEDAKEQIADIYFSISSKTNVQTAERYLDRLVSFCESLDLFPRRGLARDDLGSGMRFVPWRRQATIVIRITEGSVEILGIYRKGQDVERALRPRP